jgi:hypothetical protein
MLDLTFTANFSSFLFVGLSDHHRRFFCWSSSFRPPKSNEISLSTLIKAGLLIGYGQLKNKTFQKHGQNHNKTSIKQGEHSH